MKKIILLFLTATVLIAGDVVAQNRFFVLFDTKPLDDDSRRGVFVYSPEKSKVDAYPAIYFRIINEALGIRMSYTHFNYNITELAKLRDVIPSRDQMKRMDVPSVEAITKGYPYIDCRTPNFPADAKDMQRLTDAIKNAETKGQEIWMMDVNGVSGRKYSVFEVRNTTPNKNGFGKVEIIE